MNQFMILHPDMSHGTIVGSGMQGLCQSVQSFSSAQVALVVSETLFDRNWRTGGTPWIEKLRITGIGEIHQNLGFQHLST